MIQYKKYTKNVKKNCVGRKGKEMFSVLVQNLIKGMSMKAFLLPI